MNRAAHRAKKTASAGCKDRATVKRLITTMTAFMAADSAVAARRAASVRRAA